MKTNQMRNKGWIGTLDGSPFDETFHDLENTLENVDEALSDSIGRKRPTFWAA